MFMCVTFRFTINARALPNPRAFGMHVFIAIASHGRTWARSPPRVASSREPLAMAPAAAIVAVATVVCTSLEAPRVRPLLAPGHRARPFDVCGRRRRQAARGAHA